MYKRSKTSGSIVKSPQSASIFNQQLFNNTSLETLRDFLHQQHFKMQFSYALLALFSTLAFANPIAEPVAEAVAEPIAEPENMLMRRGIDLCPPDTKRVGQGCSFGSGDDSPHACSATEGSAIVSERSLAPLFSIKPNLSISMTPLLTSLISWSAATASGLSSVAAAVARPVAALRRRTSSAGFE